MYVCMYVCMYVVTSKTAAHLLLGSEEEVAIPKEGNVQINLYLTIFQLYVCMYVDMIYEYVCMNM